MTANDLPPSPSRKPSLIWIGAIMLLIIFASGTMAGYLDAMNAKGRAPFSAAAGVGMVAGFGSLLLGLYLSRFGRFWEAWSPRKKRYMFSLVISALVGVAASVVLRIGSTEDPSLHILRDGPFSAGAAWALAALWVFGMALSLFIYHRSVDDHEEKAYLWAGLAGFYAVIFPTPVWWLLSRADIVPPVDAIAILIFATVVNVVVYLWLKFR
jgi:hypothetical protein